jgi:hypothetical protein
MAGKFPWPSLNKIVENDPQIVKVPMDTAEWGARMSAQPKDIKNSMTLEHFSTSKK